jgi:tetratricopeptide (TPR) repeat protein
MPVTSTLVLGLLLAATAPKTARPVASPAPPPGLDAVALYDEGKYAEACDALRKMDAAGPLPGPQLYRLFFCEKSLGNDAASQAALTRASETLEKENTDKAPLEIPFYLANAYSNQRRPQDARAVAEAATKSLESGARAQPTGVIESFQVGKLYQDQGRPADAVTWYAKAVDGYDPKSKRYAGSIRWALRYTSAVAVSKGDFAASEAALDKLTAMGEVESADWIGLAVARGRRKKYEPASDAWKQAVQLDPAGADDPRYASRVALVASKLPSLPTVAPEGKTYQAMSGEELEAAMKAEAEAVRDVHARAAKEMKAGEDGVVTAPLDTVKRAALASELDAIRGRFFAAAMEYSLRRGPIRETAFREGYAVLIFQDREWELPPDPK